MISIIFWLSFCLKQNNIIKKAKYPDKQNQIIKKKDTSIPECVPPPTKNKYGCTDAYDIAVAAIGPSRIRIEEKTSKNQTRLDTLRGETRIRPKATDAEILQAVEHFLAKCPATSCTGTTEGCNSLFTTVHAENDLSGIKTGFASKCNPTGTEEEEEEISSAEESSVEADKESSAEAGKESEGEAGKESAAEAGKESAAEAGKESAGEAGKESAAEAGKESAAEAEKSVEEKKSEGQAADQSKAEESGAQDSDNSTSEGTGNGNENPGGENKENRGIITISTSITLLLLSIAIGNIYFLA